MSYIDGFVIAAPTANRQEVIDYAARFDPIFIEFGALGMELGLEWGGNWTSIVDQPHFQLRPAWAGDMTDRAMLAELRWRTQQGEDIA